MFPALQALLRRFVVGADVLRCIFGDDDNKRFPYEHSIVLLTMQASGRSRPGHQGGATLLEVGANDVPNPEWLYEHLPGLSPPVWQDRSDRGGVCTWHKEALDLALDLTSSGRCVWYANI